MLKVKELVKRLNKLDPELPVWMYIGEVEEYGSVEEISVVETQDELPYSTGDKPRKDRLPMALISGWLNC